MRRLSFFVLLIFLFSSCKKDNFNPSAYYNCHKSQGLDSSAIASQIIGTWKWSLKYCSFPEKTNYPDKEITVVFRSDSSFSVMEKINVITQGMWILTPEDNEWSVNLSSPSEYFYGKILFCGDEVLFNKSYVDGCDYLFKRN